ncbi:MAG TPA: DUF523 domain-containing protein [Desulfobulbaceae bacterium]|nr:DUF523 domain-containing protein [Desulfobulbaceae bacterium]
MIKNLPERCLVSACLMGLCTRYDGKRKPDERCIEQLAGQHWIPICPEQLGGLSTPRTPADFAGGDGHDVLTGQAAIIDANGRDVSAEFIRGARQVLAIARAQQIEYALLKARSPSCGLHNPVGVTTALLLENNIRCSEFG